MEEPCTPERLEACLERLYLGIPTPEDRDLLIAWQSSPDLFLRWSALSAPFQERYHSLHENQRRAWLASPDAAVVRSYLEERTGDEVLLSGLLGLASQVGRVKLQGGAPYKDPLHLARRLWENRNRFSLTTELEAEAISLLLDPSPKDPS